MGERERVGHYPSFGWGWGKRREKGGYRLMGEKARGCGRGKVGGGTSLICPRVDAACVRSMKMCARVDAACARMI